MVLEFLNDIYAYLFIPFGLIAILMGVDRALRSEEEESEKLKLIGGISGLLMLGLVVILTLNDYESTTNIITNYSILFGLLLGMSLIARPFKRLPIAFAIAILVSLGLLYLLMTNRDRVQQFGSVSLKVILLIALIIVLLIFIISFVQEQALDAFLFVMGWGPIITILGIVLLAQGITLIFEIPTVDGILGELPG